MVGCQEEPSEDEVDLLQYSDGFCDQSRLGCQVKLTAQRDTQIIRNPKSRTG
jgi:ferredoxin